MESEGAKEFEDLFVIGRRGFKQAAESFDQREQDQGAFFQPKQLSDFVNSILDAVEKNKSDGMSIEKPLQNLTDDHHEVLPTKSLKHISHSSNINSTSDQGSNRNSNSGVSLQQICRRWLKHTYLGIGEPCVSAGPIYIYMRSYCSSLIKSYYISTIGSVRMHIYVRFLVSVYIYFV